MISEDNCTKSKIADIKSIKHLLWDVDLQEFNPYEYTEFLADRIAEKGRSKDLKWFFDMFGVEIFLGRIFKSPNISTQTKNFWKLLSCNSTVSGINPNAI